MDQKKLEQLIDAANGVLFLFPSRDYPDSTIGGRALADLESAITAAGGTVRRPRAEVETRYVGERPTPCEHEWGAWRKVYFGDGTQLLGQACDCRLCGDVRLEDWIEDVTADYSKDQCPSWLLPEATEPPPESARAATDNLYPRAVQVVKAAHPRICVANLQRMLRIGYNRAMRLMEAMVADGVIEAYDTGHGGTGYRLLKAQEASS